MRSKIKIRICILLLGVMAALGLIRCFDLQKSQRKMERFLAAKEEYVKHSSEFELALWNEIEMMEDEEIELCLRWWYDRSEDKYYFFLPEQLREKRMHWLFSQTEQIYIDDKPVQNGSLFDLKEGCYQVSAALPQGEKSCELEIRYSSKIASLFLNTESVSMDYLHETKEHEEAGNYLLLSATGSPYYFGRIEKLRCRGNASWEETEKKSYQMKLAEKTDLLGMGEDKQWLLLANAFDHTLLRNSTAFHMAKAMELSYTPDAEWVDVYANGEYIGNYLLTEKVEIDKERVNISDLEEQMESMNQDKALEEYEFFMEQQGRLFSTKGYRIAKEPQDITGGYLLEIEMSDRYGLEASGFITSRMQPVVFKSPKYASYAQVSYIAERYQDFEDAVFSEDGCSPYTGRHFSEYIDMTSFAKKYLLEEITKNLDAAFTSQFFYKPADNVSTKFFAGPAWDYDKSIAASGITQEGIDLHNPIGLYAAEKTKDSDIWYALYHQKEFRELVIELYEEGLETRLRNIAASIEADSKHIMDSAMNNAIRWDIFAEAPTPEGKQVIYEEKVGELSDFLEQRLSFLKQEWGVQE